MGEERDIRPFTFETLSVPTKQNGQPASKQMKDFCQMPAQNPENHLQEPALDMAAQTVDSVKPSAPELTEGEPDKAPAPEAPSESICPTANSEVIDHTASLWKYNPIPTEEPEPSPEYLSIKADYPTSKIIAARVRGKKHKHEGTNCDDWYEVSHFEDITFLAVSDGAGSKQFSRIGAKTSCKAAIGYLTRAFADTFASRPSLRDEIRLPLGEAKCMDACTVLAGVVQQSVVKAYEAVEAAYYSRAADPAFRAVLQRDLEIKDLSGTLLIAVVIPLCAETKEHLIISCQVGDGMIAVFNTKGSFSSSLKLMGEPDSGDFSGETDFLTSPKMHQIETLQNRTRISRGIFDLVMVMSDGVADDYFPNETEMRRLYYDLVANDILKGKESTLSLENLNQQQLRMIKRMPDPVAYPWVNDQSIKIPLHYMSRICEVLSLSLEDIWTDSTVLNLCQRDIDERIRTETVDKRLLIWLDNYVQRGSFDDRTLVIATM